MWTTSGNSCESDMSDMSHSIVMCATLEYCKRLQGVPTSASRQAGDSRAQTCPPWHLARPLTAEPRCLGMVACTTDARRATAVLRPSGVHAPTGARACATTGATTGARARPDMMAGARATTGARARPTGARACAHGDQVSTNRESDISDIYSELHTWSACMSSSASTRRMRSCHAHDSRHARAHGRPAAAPHAVQACDRRAST